MNHLRSPTSSSCCEPHSPKTASAGNLECKSCVLFALMPRFLREQLLPGDKLNLPVLQKMIQNAKPESLVRLAPFIARIDPARVDEREQALHRLCSVPIPTTAREAIALCVHYEEDAERRAQIAEREARLAEKKAKQAAQSQVRRKQTIQLVQPLTLTGLSLALAGLHIGISASIRDEPADRSAFFAYQGVAGGAMLGLGLGIGIATGASPSLERALFGILTTPVLGILGAIGGGLGGAYAGRDPGAGRVVVGTLSQVAILIPVLVWTWGPYSEARR